MQTRQYRRRRGRTSWMSYVLPLGLCVALVVLVVLSVNLIVNMQRVKDQDVQSQPLALLDVEKPGTYSLLDGKRREIPVGLTAVHVGNEEGVGTEDGAHVTLELLTKDIVRLGSLSELFTRWTKEKELQVELKQGEFWFVAGEAPTERNVQIRSSRIQGKLSAKSTVAISVSEEEEVIRVLHGVLTLTLLKNMKGVADIQVGVGQEVRINTMVLDQFLADTSYSPVTAIADDFKKSSWYTFNIGEDEEKLHLQYISASANTNGSMVENSNNNKAEEVEEMTNSNANAQDTPRAKVDITNIVEGQVVSAATVNVRGTFAGDISAIYINGKAASLSAAKQTWSIQGLSLSKEGNNVLRVTYDTSELQGIRGETITVKRQTEKLASPVLTVPQASTISTATTLKGTVGKTIVKVVVNNHTLQRFVSGSGTWQYNLSEANQNLQKGKNTYQVVGYDADGAATETLRITLTYVPSEDKDTASGAGL